MFYFLNERCHGNGNLEKDLFLQCKFNLLWIKMQDKNSDIQRSRTVYYRHLLELICNVKYPNYSKLDISIST